jgi:hypothetical protein
VLGQPTILPAPERERSTAPAVSGGAGPEREPSILGYQRCSGEPEDRLGAGSRMIFFCRPDDGKIVYHVNYLLSTSSLGAFGVIRLGGVLRFNGRIALLCPTAQYWKGQYQW